MAYFAQTLKAFHSFRAEVCTLSQLTHPCIVSLLAVCPSHLAYVMDLCTLGSLRRVLSAEGGVMGTGRTAGGAAGGAAGDGAGGGAGGEGSGSRASCRLKRTSLLQQGMPLDRFLTYKIICQVGKFLRTFCVISLSFICFIRFYC